MKSQTEADRRQYPRFPPSPGLARMQVALRGLRQQSEVHLCGQIENISASGLCLLTDQPVEVSEVFRCALPFPELPLVIPTLLQVRWARETGQGQYLAGLRFVF